MTTKVEVSGTEVEREMTMGQTSKKLHERLQKMGSPLGSTIRSRRGGPDIPSVEDFIEDGLDPVFAAYAFVQHIVSHFAEAVSQLPEMKKYTKLVGKAEDEYMPSGPPMSPLTASFFTCWAFFDCQFDGKDTLASCLMESNDLVQMNPHQFDALKKMAESRMGVYEHIGTDGGQVQLRELLTDKEFPCVCGSGYRGHKGELWYVRLLPPPLEPEIASYQVVFHDALRPAESHERRLDAISQADDAQGERSERGGRAAPADEIRTGAELLERVRLQGVSPRSKRGDFPRRDSRHPGHASPCVRIQPALRLFDDETEITKTETDERSLCR